MAYRKIKGRLEKVDGQPFVGIPITFGLIVGSYSDNIQYPRNQITTKTNNQGYFEVMLWVTDEGLSATKYRCLFLGEDFLFEVPSGSGDLELSSLRSQSGRIVRPPAEVRDIPMQLQDGRLQLSKVPINPDRMIVFVNGEKVVYGDDFVVNGSTITWVGDYQLDNKDTIEVYY